MRVFNISEKRHSRSVTLWRESNFHPMSLRLGWVHFRSQRGGEPSPVLLNEGLETIGVFAFASCASLTKIQLPSTVVKIGDRAFCGNTLFIYMGRGWSRRMPNLSSFIPPSQRFLLMHL
mmetsp:Transcript_43819/g.74813  ORF Transcript_43819/g.74813 Transcript_43819/m.74813 type:complete len:119 (-) Transcript_43819:425-781(-)